MARLALLLLLCVCSCLADTHTYMGESDEEMLRRAKEEARRMGKNPDDVVRMGAPFAGEWDDETEGKRCSGCIGSIIELHAELDAAGKKRWNHRKSRGGSSPLKELVVSDAIDQACGTRVRDYGFGEEQGLKGYYHERQKIVRTMQEKIGLDLAEMCFRLAEDADREGLLADAYLRSRGDLARKACVDLNRNEPKSVYFGGRMCSQESAQKWMGVLMPGETPTIPDAAETDIKLNFEQFVANYGYRLKQSEKSGGPGSQEMFRRADQNGDGALSRAEISEPSVRRVLAPRTVDIELFRRKFASAPFTGGRSVQDVFAALDKDGDQLVSVEEIRSLKDYMDTKEL